MRSSGDLDGVYSYGDALRWKRFGAGAQKIEDYRETRHCLMFGLMWSVVWALQKKLPFRC
jgi:hypothetical protein